MANSDITSQDFPLSFNSYATFDAVTLKGLMQQRLIDGGVFTDQIFEGSNFNSLLDVIAYSYHVLLFYLKLLFFSFFFFLSFFSFVSFIFLIKI